MTSSALTYGGFALGSLLGILFCQSVRDALTIGIETGIQNLAICTYMLITTLPEPWSTLSIIVPITHNFTIFVPYIIYLLTYKCYSTLRRNQLAMVPTNDDVKESNQESIELVTAVGIKSDLKK